MLRNYVKTAKSACGHCSQGREKGRTQSQNIGALVKGGGSPPKIRGGEKGRIRHENRLGRNRKGKCEGDRQIRALELVTLFRAGPLEGLRGRGGKEDRSSEGGLGKTGGFNRYHKLGAEVDSLSTGGRKKSEIDLKSWCKPTSQKGWVCREKRAPHRNRARP